MQSPSLKVSKTWLNKALDNLALNGPDPPERRKSVWGPTWMILWLWMAECAVRLGWKNTVLPVWALQNFWYLLLPIREKLEWLVIGKRKKRSIYHVCYSAEISSFGPFYWCWNNMQSMSKVLNIMLTVVSCISKFSFNQDESLAGSDDFLIYFIIIWPVHLIIFECCSLVISKSYVRSKRYIA